MTQKLLKPENKVVLPDDYQRYTDKYFTRSREILEGEGINPEVSLKVFARGEGKIVGLNEAVDIFEKYRSDLSENGGEVWVTKKNEFETKEPLMIVRGPAQDVVEMETMYLGVLSHNLTEKHPDYEIPTEEQFQREVERVTDIYDEVEVPLLYFGARHYHWSQDEEFGRAALKAGAVQTSTDAGSTYIGENGVGTTPHFLTIVLADQYGPDEATLKTAQLFDEHIDEEVSRVTLVDTFNEEIDDSLKIAEYFNGKYGDDWKHKFRVDTCGENIAQGGEEFDPHRGKYETGRGVRIEPVKKLRDRLIDEGYGDNTEIILSSGFGDPEKARAFVEAQKKYREKSRKEFGKYYDLFSAIGAGAFTDGIHCTSDIYEVNGRPLAKTGREVDPEEMNHYMEKNMKRVI
ncbi:MAG: nicotinate phosphoribosyltransferase [Candidatus Aenigmatarchaeota archaeon]